MSGNTGGERPVEGGDSSTADSSAESREQGENHRQKVDQHVQSAT